MIEKIGEKKKWGRLVEFEWGKMGSFSCYGLWKGKGCVKEKEKGQIFPFYNTMRKNSPTVWLEPLCDQRSRLFNDFYYWDERTLQNLQSMVTIWGTEASHALREKHAIICTNCTVTVRTSLPKCDTCPTNTKRHQLKRFAEKLKWYASTNHSWSYIILNLIRSAPSEVEQNAPR